ncbi:MAG: hypothetical protein WBQ53_06815 [Methylocystis sp.]
MQKFCRKLKAFEADTRGNVTILSGLAITMLLAFASLGAEYGAGLLLQSENQRIADSAAFIAATYCANKSQCSTSTTLSTATAIAQNIGALNGIPAADVTPAIVTSPSGATGAEALQIQVSTTKFLMITPIEGAPNFLSLTALSYGQIGATASAAACVIGLSASGGNAYSGAGGIAFSGGASLSAPNCGVATNNTITAANCGGPWLTAKTLSYNTTAPTPTSPVGGGNCGSAWMNPTSATKAAVTDPLASLSGVTTAQARVATAQALTAPSAPSVTVTAASGGTTFPISGLGWSSTTPVSSGGCTATWNSGASMWSVVCTSATPIVYNVNSAIVNGPGMSLSMASGSAAATFNFNVALNMGYVTSSFGPATYNFMQPVTLSGTTAFGVVSASSGNNSFGAGTYNFASTLTTSSGTAVFGPGNFNVVGAVSLSDSVNIFNASTALASGPSIATTTLGTASYTYDFAKGLTTGGGVVTAFGAGIFNFGSTGATCNGEGAFSICNGGGSTLEMGSASSLTSSSTFTLSNGVYTSGGTTVLMGLQGTSSPANSNSFNIGPGTDGNALFLTGGAIVTLADTEDGTGVFQLTGNVNSAGGGCTTISAATQHDIKGSFNVSGGTMLGAGVYTLTGYFAAGATSGGNVTCNGTSVGVSASGVTIVYDGAYPGTFSASSPTCAGAGFCLGAGFSNVTLTAPTSGTYQQLVVVGPAIASGVTAGTLLTAGSGATLSGAFYTPNGQIYMNGGASAVSGGCLEVIGSIIQVTQGASAATACSALNGSTGTSSAIPAGIVQ